MQIGAGMYVDTNGDIYQGFFKDGRSHMYGRQEQDKLII